MSVIIERTVGGRQLRLVADSLLPPTPSVDGIVSSDDTLLSHGGGVSAAVWEAAALSLADLAETDRNRSLRLGDVIASGPGRLDLAKILHVAILDIEEGLHIQSGQAVDVWTRVLDVAAEAGLSAIAAPAVGASVLGIGGSVSTLCEALSRRRGLYAKLARIDLHLITEEPAEREAAVALVEGQTDRWVLGLQDIREADKSAEGLRFHLKLALQTLHGDGSWNRRRVRPAIDAALSGLEHGLGLALSRAGHRPAGQILPVPEAVAKLHELNAPATNDHDRSESLRRAVEARERLVLGESPRLGDLALVYTGIVALLGHESESTPKPTGLGWVAANLRAIPSGAANAMSTAAEWASSAPASTWALAESLVSAMGSAPTLPAAPAAAHPEPEVSVETEVDPTRAIRNLYELFREEFSEEERSRQAEDLRINHHYRGSDESVLLEHLVRAPSPVVFLRDWFRQPDLHRIYERQFGQRPASRHDAEHVAKKIAGRLGFTVMELPPSLETVRENIDRREWATRTQDRRDRLWAAVADTGRELEQVVMVTLRFLAQACFHKSIDRLARDEGWVERRQLVSKASLGRQLELLSRLGSLLAEEESAQAVEMRRSIDVTALNPKRSQRVTALRNKLIHPDTAEADLDLEILTERVRELLREARAFLDHLLGDESEGRGRIYPIVCRVTEIRIDRWGRTIVEAEDDRGKQELIVSRENLQPGHIYYMHARSNPIRVDPIIVHGQDLSRDD